MRNCCLIIVSFLLTVFSLGEVSRVTLKSGNQLTGEVVHEQSDTIYLDVGYTMLAIPRSAIVSLNLATEETPEDQSQTLYSELTRRRQGTVNELSERRGEAVVLVRTPLGLGSGFVVNPEGYVVTNNHVISGEREIAITVFKQQGKELSKDQYDNVRIVATNPLLDLALLQIVTEADMPSAFAYVPLGNSDDLVQGQPVFAIGSPLGLERTVSEGIVSNRNRPFGGLVYIQSTAEISPGNSGGPLLNLYGEVIGVNNMKVIGMGAEGLGFAIPSNMLKHFLKNRDAFAFDPLSPNAGFRYNSPPNPESDPTE